MGHGVASLVIRHTHRLPSPTGPDGHGDVAARQFDAALMSVGFKLSADLLAHLSGLSEDTVVETAGPTLPTAPRSDAHSQGVRIGDAHSSTDNGHARKGAWPSSVRRARADSRYENSPSRPSSGPIREWAMSNAPPFPGNQLAHLVRGFRWH